LGGGKIFDFRRKTLFSSEKRHSKHKMAKFSKNLGWHCLFAPPLAMPMPFPKAMIWFLPETLPFSPAKAPNLAELCKPITRQAIELESYPNHPRIQ